MVFLVDKQLAMIDAEVMELRDIDCIISFPAICVDDRIRTGEIFYTATAIPTPEDAAIDEMTYEECVELFFEALDQPWKEIGSAQENILLPEFNQAEKIRFVTQEGTDFTVDIAENLILEFKDGRLVSWSAEKEQQFFEDANPHFSQDEAVNDNFC